MSLLSALATTSTALQVFSAALGTDQVNVSNSATPGFAAVRAVIRPITDTIAVSPGEAVSGSDTVQIQSSSNSYADAAVQAASSQATFSQTSADGLSPINQVFDITGTSGILAAFQRFSSAFSGLSVSPSDSTLKATAIAAAGSVAAAFRVAARTLDSQESSLASQVQTTVGSINDLSNQIRQYNVAIRRQSSVDPATDSGLRSALDQLSNLTDITVTKNQDGTVNVLTGGQQPLVLGDQSYRLQANLSAAPESQITSTGGGHSPGRYSGQLGALLEVRNGTLQALVGGQGVTGSLNELALGFASRVNAVLSGGVTSSGGQGVPIFTYDASNSGDVARTLALDSTVTPDTLAVGSTGTSAQSNGVSNELAALPSSSATADQIAGQSAESFFASIAGGIGQQLSDARSQASTDAAALTSAQSARQQVSGVSLDTEAVSITSYQRAYQASARLVSILDQLTSDEVNLIK